MRFRGGNDRMPGLLNVPAELFGEGSGFIDVVRYCARRGDYGPGDPEALAIDRLKMVMSSEDGMSLERVTWDGRIFDARHAKLPDGGWVVTYSDVTEERRNTRKLAESEERLRQVMDNAVDAIVLVNQRGVIESINHAARRIFGYAPSELIGRDVIMLMTEEEGLSHAAFMQRHIRDDRPLLVNVAREMQGRHKDGRALPLEVSSSEFGPRTDSACSCPGATCRSARRRGAAAPAAEARGARPAHRRRGARLQQSAGRDHVGRRERDGRPGARPRRAKLAMCRAGAPSRRRG